MKTKPTAFCYDIVTYIQRTGDEKTCFNRYPDWLQNWIEENSNNIKFCPQGDGIADLCLFKDSTLGELKYNFRLGDCIIKTLNGVKIGFEGIQEILLNNNILQISDDN